MRIGIDYTSAVQQGAGIGRLTRELVHALAAVDDENKYVLLQPRNPRRKETAPASPNFSLLTLPFTEWMGVQLWQRLRLPLPIELLSGRLDILHSPDFVLPAVRSARTVVTIHDLSFLVHPECFPPSLVRYLERMVPRAIQRADHLLADSESTKNDLVRLLGVKPDAVTVAYCGVGPQFQSHVSSDERARVRRRYGLLKPFILSLGTLQPRKNLSRLVEAFAIARPHLPADIELVLAGGEGWLNEELHRTVTRLGLPGIVRFPGYVDEADLPGLLTAAEAFASVSLYEGFGLPPLEAMACGTPIVVSDSSSHPEVVGTAGLLVDPVDTPAIGAALERVLLDEALRKRLREEGPLQASHFRWEDGARQVLSVYRALGAVGAGG